MNRSTVLISSLSTICAAFVVAPLTALATPTIFSQEFPSGFSVRINGGAFTPSGPLTVTGLVDDTTTDIDPSVAYGEFPLASVTLTGAGYLNRTVITPLSLLTFELAGEQHFAFQRQGQFNVGVIGWNGSTSFGDFMTDVNYLSTLVALPYTTSGDSTFWYAALGGNAWVLAGGDSIGASIGSSAPTGTFSITRIPEPSAVYLAALGFAGLVLAKCGRRGQSPAMPRVDVWELNSSVDQPVE